MSDSLYIGSCVYEPQRHTRIDPFAVAENGCWRRFFDWTKALPPEGRVFAPSLPGYHENDLVIFHVVAKQQDKDGRDKFLVSGPQKPVEVLDYRAVDAEIARRTIVEEGLTRDGDGRQKVLVALRDGTGVCVTLERHPDGKRDIAVTDGLDELAVHLIDSRIFNSDLLRSRVYAVPGQTLGVKVGVVNWCLDADFLKAVLGRLRRANGDGFPFTRNQINRLIQVLARARLAPSNGEDLRALTTRLTDFAADLGERVEALDAFVDTIAALRPVADGLAERRRKLEADLRTEIAPRVRIELEAAEGELAVRRDRLLAEVEELEQAAEIARGKTVAAAEDLAVAKAALGKNLSALLDTLSQVSGSVTGKEIAGHLSGRLSKSPEIWPAPAPPWARQSDAIRENLHWSEFPARLRDNAEQFGFDFDDLAFADVAARSGRVVLLPAHEATAFVRCYAGVVAGECWARHVLDPAVLSADDLWRRPLTSEPTALSLGWTAAKLDPGYYRIVLLDGVHRTPMDLWAPTLVEVLQAGDRPVNLLVFASFGPELLDAARGWNDAAEGMAAFFPKPRSALNAEVLGAAVGRPTRKSRFDPTMLPPPTDSDLLQHVATISPEASAAAVARSLAAVRAAHPLIAQLDPALVARVFSTGADLPEVMRRGAEQARAVLGSSKH